MAQESKRVEGTRKKGAGYDILGGGTNNLSGAPGPAGEGLAYCATRLLNFTLGR